jgi:hypothetical protein
MEGQKNIMLRFKGVRRKLDKHKGGGGAATSKVLSLVGNGIFRIFSTSFFRSFIKYFIIICVSILSVSQDGLLLLIKFLKFICFVLLLGGGRKLFRHL